MKQYLSYIWVAFLASLSGFIVHVFDVDFFQKWICGMPVGISYSWNIILLAALTSMEVGIGVMIIYAAIRNFFLRYHTLYRGLILGVIILAVKGVLFRQLIMDILVGGFAWQVLVRDGMSWVVSITMCIVLAFLYEGFIVAAKKKKVSRQF